MIGKISPLPHQNQNFFLGVACILLVTLIVLIYGQTVSHEFVFDDEMYILTNPVVSQGLTRDGIMRVFSFHVSDRNTYWHPLTWISHMLDVEVFGLNPAGHHVVNIFLHILNTLLLLWMIVIFTNNLSASLIVALLFAIHPLNVENVAWVAERKNLLSCFLGISTCIAYKYYTDAPAFRRYLNVLVIFILCLLAKPAFVVLPVLLLLIDAWPLERLQFDKNKIRYTILLFAEKVPLFLLSIISVTVSTVSLKQYGVGHPGYEVLDGTRVENTLESFVRNFSEIPFGTRIENALVSYVDYIIKIIWPSKLAVFYPYPEFVPAIQWLGALVILSTITIIAFKKYNSMPYILFGWLWFLISILPVSGLIQAGLWPAMADRWVYLPGIGIFIIFAWVFVYLYESFTQYKVILVLFGVLLLAVYTVKAYNQTSLWKNQLTLFRHAIQFAPNNYAICLNYANALVDNNYIDESFEYYYKALHDQPQGYKAHYALGYAFLKIEKYEDAIYHLRNAINFSPDTEREYFTLAVALEKNNQNQESIVYFKKALLDDPESSKNYLALGGVYEKIGNFEEAVKLYKRSISLDAGNIKAYNAFGILLAKQGNLAASIKMFNLALQIDPDDKLVQDNLSKAIGLTQQ